MIVGAHQGDTGPDRDDRDLDNAGPREEDTAKDEYLIEIQEPGCAGHEDTNPGQNQ